MTPSHGQTATAPCPDPACPGSALDCASRASPSCGGRGKGGGLRAGLAVPILFAIAAITTFLALGTWQIERKSWKENLIKTMDERLTAAPIDLPARALWPHLEQATDEFRQVRFSATLVPGTSALVYAGAPAAQGAIPVPGYWVFALARLESGDKIVINRGFLPEARKDAATAADSSHDVMVGVMRWPQAASYFAPKDDPGANLWFARDHISIAASKGWGEVAPFYVDLERPAPAGGFPNPGRPMLLLRNQHLQYAITWYGLAAVVTFMFVYWLGTHRRTGRDAASL